MPMNKSLVVGDLMTNDEISSYLYPFATCKRRLTILHFILYWQDTTALGLWPLAKAVSKLIGLSLPQARSTVDLFLVADVWPHPIFAWSSVSSATLSKESLPYFLRNSSRILWEFAASERTFKIKLLRLHIAFKLQIMRQASA